MVLLRHAQANPLASQFMSFGLQWHTSSKMLVGRDGTGGEKKSWSESSGAASSSPVLPSLWCQRVQLNNLQLEMKTVAGLSIKLLLPCPGWSNSHQCYKLVNKQTPYPWAGDRESQSQLFCLARQMLCAQYLDAAQESANLYSSNRCLAIVTPNLIQPCT